MQGHNVTNLEGPATEGRRLAQDTPDAGRCVAFSASDLTDDDVEELKQQGLTFMERDEDGYIVFVLDNDSHTGVDEEMAGKANTDSEDGEDEEGEEDDDDDDDDDDEDEDEDEEGDEPGKDYKGRTVPNDDECAEFDVHGTSRCPGRNLEIHCELDVMTTCIRKDPAVVKYFMKLQYLKLKLPNYVDNDGVKGYFVHRIIISAKPTEEWRPKIKRVIAEPSDDSDPTTVTFQKSKSVSKALSLNSVGVVQGQLSDNTSKAWSHSDTEFGWSRADPEADVDANGNPPSWSVKWTWNLKYWKGGHQIFNQEKPWKFSTVKPFKVTKPIEYFRNPLPELPYFSSEKPEIELTNLQHNWAEWRTSPEIGGVENIEWDVEVDFFTTKLWKRDWSLTNGLKTSYEAEILRPGQMTRIRKRVTVRPRLESR